MSTNSSILAWKILWTKEPGGLQSMGPQKDTTERALTQPSQPHTQKDTLMKIDTENYWGMSRPRNKPTHIGLILDERAKNTQWGKDKSLQ